MKAAFQGVHGAYSELAARRLLGENCRTVPMETFDRVFEAVESGEVDRGVLPIENSLAGSIHQNYDLLMTHDLHIVAETHLRVEHVLMGLPGASLESLARVRSHPQALAQCAAFFRTHPAVKAEVFFDTAGAAKSLCELPDGESNRVGAIAGAHAAELYGLKVLRKNLEDRPHNYTRFLVVSRKPLRGAPEGPVKCSVAFVPHEHRQGALFRMLGVFALRDIDLLRIESRPNPEAPFEYRFHLDFSGHPAEPRVAKALDHLREMVDELRILGAYPVGMGDYERKKRRTS